MCSGTPLVSARQIREVAEKPLVSVDLYGNGSVSCVTPTGTFVSLPTNGNDWILPRDVTSHRNLRKVLSHAGTEDYLRAVEHVLATNMKNKKTTIQPDELNPLRVIRPHLLLGARRLQHVMKETLELFHHDRRHVIPDKSSSSSTSLAIEELTGTMADENKSGVSIQNGSIAVEGPNQTDDDRVTFQLDLLPGQKKPLSMLPDEAVSLILFQARRRVELYAAKNSNSVDKNNSDETGTECDTYPLVVTVPGWHQHDAVLEAHMEATMGSSSPSLLYHRSVATMVGVLAKCPDKMIKAYTKKVKALEQFAKEMNLKNNHTTTAATTIAMAAEDTIPWALLVNATQDGLEVMACHLSSLRNCPEAPFGSIQVLAQESVRWNSTTNNDNDTNDTDTSEDDEVANKIFDAVAPMVTNLLKEESLTADELVQRVCCRRHQRKDVHCVIEALIMAGKFRLLHNGKLQVVR